MFSEAATLAHLLQEVRRGDFALAARLALGVERGAQEIHGGDAGNFDRILERQEHALGGALVRRHGQEVLALEQDLAAGDFITRLAGDDVASVDLPEPFGPMMACTSPAPTVSESPWRICVPDTDVQVFISSNVVILFPCGLKRLN